MIRRNPFYGGSRPHHVDGFDVDLRAPSPDEPIRRIERGEADWTTNLMPVFLNPALGLMAKYGINRSRFFSQPGLALRMFAFNSSRPLFRNNPALRRGGELRARPAGAAGDRRWTLGRPAHRPVHPAARARLSRRRRLSARARRSGAGERAGARQPPGWQGGLLHGRLRLPPRGRAAREAAARGDRARDRDQAAAGAHRQRGVPRRAREAGCGVGHRARRLDAEPARPAGLSQPPARHAARRRNQRRRLHLGRLRPRASARGEGAAGSCSGSSRTAPWTYGSRATPRRSPRSASSTSRRSSPIASAASSFDRRSCSPPSA